MKLESLKSEKFQSLATDQLGKIIGGADEGETGATSVKFAGKIYDNCCDDFDEKGHLWFFITDLGRWVDSLLVG